MAKPENTAYSCRYCRASMQFCFEYVCTKCGRHNDEMYRAEHVDPVRAASLTRAEIQAEYAAAGGLEYRDG